MVGVGEVEEEAVPQPGPTKGRHLKKRALKNKSLAVTFNEKDLRYTATCSTSIHAFLASCYQTQKKPDTQYVSFSVIFVCGAKILHLLRLITIVMMWGVLVLFEGTM